MLNAHTGRKLWSHHAGNGSYSPAVANGVVYLSPADGYVRALNAGTGTQLWRYDTGGANDNAINSPPAVAIGLTARSTGSRAEACMTVMYR
jgi:outer membrane protein assembly factor BamB